MHENLKLFISVLKASYKSVQEIQNILLNVLLLITKTEEYISYNSIKKHIKHVISRKQVQSQGYKIKFIKRMWMYQFHHLETIVCSAPGNVPVLAVPSGSGQVVSLQPCNAAKDFVPFVNFSLISRYQKAFLHAVESSEFKFIK